MKIIIEKDELCALLLTNEIIPSGYAIKNISRSATTEPKLYVFCERIIDQDELLKDAGLDKHPRVRG